MPVSRVVDERVLAPISEQKPSGDDLRALKDWVEIRKARPKPDDAMDKRDWQPANRASSDWGAYKQLVENALCTKSKDLELGIFLTEASARVDGFRGVRDGIWTLRGLLTGFSDRGLYPLPDEGGLESRYGKLDWMNEKLAEVIREIPITMRQAPEVNYSMNYRQEALRPNGMITVAEFESAVAAGTREQYEALSKELEESRAELEEFEQVVVEHFGPGALCFVESKLALEECQVAVASILCKKQPAGLSPAAGDVAPVDALPLGGSGGMAAGLVGDAWAEAERMARGGEIDAALSTMTALAAAEANGRARFQRRLLLADLLMRTNRVKLARSILEELDEIVQKHDLTHWETSDVIGAVWARLVRCYQDKNSGTANPDKAAEFFLKLSRLDPWQAVALGEPAERSE